MSAVLEAQGLFRQAFPATRFGKLENVFYQAKRWVNPRVEKDFTERRARSIWEGTARRIDSDEMDALRAAVYEETRREQRELRARLEKLDEILADALTEPSREALATFSAQVRGLGRVDHGSKEKGR